VPGNNGRRNGALPRDLPFELAVARRARRRRSRLGGGSRFPLVAGLLALLVVTGLGAVGAGAFAAHAELTNGCELPETFLRPLGETSVVYAADGTYLGAVPSDVRRRPLPPEQVSPWLRRATIAIEDRRFYEHDGVDYRAIARAAVRNAQAGEILEGGSTLTQQVARNLYLPPDRTFERKRDEACLAHALEREWPKGRILNEYLNRAYYGNRAYGVEAAAQTYFSRRASQLGPAQAALLAGVVQTPARHDPFRNPEGALQRRNAVLDAMLETGSISRPEHARARALPLNLRPGRVYTTQRAPYFFEHVRRELIREYGEEAVRHGGLRVHTTIDLRQQQLARRAIISQLGRRDDPASALVSIDPATGAIRAMASVVPGRAPDFNLATQGRRQAGSAFKPFVLLEAMRQGANPWLTWYESSEFEHVPGPGQEPWRPKTYDGSTYGPSTLSQAMLRSDNLVYAKLTLDVGPRRVAQIARRMGVRESRLAVVSSIGLGSSDVTVLEMASAYATLAAGGVYRRPYAITRVEHPDGSVDRGGRLGPAKPQRVLREAIAWHMTRILEMNVQGGTGTAAQLPRPAAGKTGTTDRYTDAWFAGYTRELATAVWVGYPARTARMLNVRGVSVTGGSFPAAIWGAFMRPALADAPVRSWATPRGGAGFRPWRGGRRYTRPATGYSSNGYSTPSPSQGYSPGYSGDG
jgi:penicillin-binding protein 1A